MMGGDENRKRGGDRFNRPSRFDEPDRLPWMEAVEEDQATMGKGQKRFLLVVSAVITIAIFTSLIFYAYDRGMQEGLNTEGEPPVVLASQGPAKVQPDDRGGLNVPDQDRLVFNTLNEQSNNSQSGQTFTAPPEQPLSRPESTQPESSRADNAQTENAITTNETATQQSQAQPTQTQPAMTDPTSGNANRGDTNTNNQTVEASQSFIPVNAYRIQLGAFGSSRSTEIAWGQMQDRYPSVLADLLLEVEPLERQSSPTLYRLRAGPFPSRADADVACASLRELGQGCFVVSP